MKIFYTWKIFYILPNVALLIRSHYREPNPPICTLRLSLNLILLLFTSHWRICYKSKQVPLIMPRSDIRSGRVRFTMTSNRVWLPETWPNSKNRVCIWVGFSGLGLDFFFFFLKYILLAIHIFLHQSLPRSTIP